MPIHITGASWLRKNVTYPLWVAKNRSPRLSYLRDLERSQYLEPHLLQELQMRKLKETLAHAYQETPYYRNLFDRVGFHPDDFKCLSDIKRLPVLSKADVRTHHADLMANSLKHDHLSKFKTGGSTGIPIEILKGADEVELINATALRAFRWAGWDIGDPVGMIWGNSPTTFSAKERMLNALISPEIYLDTMNLTDESMSRFVQQWRSTRPTLLRGHSHSIYVFASFCARKGLHDVKPQGIISSSMMLLPSERRVIEAAFACKVTNLYGCEEVGLIACECEVHNGMHLDAENNFVELLDASGNDVKPDEDGAVVVTSLLNRAMPLLRYKIGDVATMAKHACSCGRTLPLIHDISGRVADFLVRKDGSVVAGVSLVERTLTKFPGVAQMQIVQEDIDTIRLRIVRDAGYGTATELALIEEFKASVGVHNAVILEFVTAIPQEPSGKFRFAISKVANPFT